VENDYYTINNFAILHDCTMSLFKSHGVYNKLRSSGAVLLRVFCGRIFICLCNFRGIFLMYNIPDDCAGMNYAPWNDPGQDDDYEGEEE